MQTGPVAVQERLAAPNPPSLSSAPVPAPRQIARQETVALVRVVAVLGLLSVALIHLLDLPATMGPAPVQGALYVMLVVGCLGGALVVVHGRAPARWALVGLLGVTPAIAYVLTRTVGLPFDTGDVGNWGDQLGIASLFVESLVVFSAAWALRLEQLVLDGAGAPTTA
jgi:hypothetical protein